MFGIDDVLTGGLSLLGGITNNLFAQQNQEDAQAFNAEQAQLNRQFQARQFATRYQTTARDMEKAGLNRILAIGGASGQPTGSAASSTPGAPVHDMLGPAVNSAMQHARLKEEIKNMQETNENIKSDSDKKKTESRLNIIEGDRADAETQLTKDQNAIIVQNLSKAQLEAARSKIDMDQINNPAFRILRQTGNVGEEVQRASSAIGNVPALINAGNARRGIKLREDTFKERFGVP